MLRFRVNINGPTGAPYLSTFHFAGTAQEDIATPRGNLVTFMTALDAHWGNATSWSLDPEVEFVDPATGEITGLGTATTASGSGNLTATYLPPACQALIRWRTSAFFNGRQLQGRTFVPGMTTANSDGGGGLTSTVQAAYAAAAAALVASTPQTLVIWSRRNLDAENVTSAVVPAKFAVLRSRRD